VTELELEVLRLSTKLQGLIEITRTALLLLQAAIVGREVDPQQVNDLIQAIDELTAD
jgi:hypothetical protein